MHIDRKRKLTVDHGIRVENKDCGKENTLTTTKRFQKELTWEIENFVDWWSSREVAESNRNENLTWLEDIDHEKPQDWEKSSTSPILTLEIDGVMHEFRLAILKYDSWDLFEDEHYLMMGISLVYNGPFESIIVKPLFYLENSGKEYGNPIKAQKLYKEHYSEARIFSSFGFGYNKEKYARKAFKVMCLAQVNMITDDPKISKLENQLASKKTWKQCLLDGINFSEKRGNFEQFSDFEIICVEKDNNGEELKTHFRCHKLVLFLGSPYYKHMFSSNFIENQGTSKVTDISSRTMTKLLNYMYSNQLDKSQLDIDLLYASDKYQIETLKMLCELELGSNITIATTPMLAQAAYHCGSTHFKNHVFRFLRKHWKQINCIDELNLIRKNPNLLSEVLDYED